MHQISLSHLSHHVPRSRVTAVTRFNPKTCFLNTNTVCSAYIEQSGEDENKKLAKLSAKQKGSWTSAPADFSLWQLRLLSLSV